MLNRAGFAPPSQSLTKLVFEILAKGAECPSKLEVLLGTTNSDSHHGPKETLVIQTIFHHSLYRYVFLSAAQTLKMIRVFVAGSGWSYQRKRYYRMLMRTDDFFAGRSKRTEIL